MERTTKIISLSVPPEMAEKIQELMKKEDRTRSELIRETIRRYIEQQEWKETLRYGRIKAKEKGITENQVEDIVDAYRK